MKYVVFSIGLLFFSLVSCDSAEESDVQVYDLEQKLKETEIKYNGEYLKVVDPNEKEERPKRAIHGNAAIYQGEVQLNLKNLGYKKKINSFKKAFTSLHLSEEGIRMRMQDMDDFQMNIALSQNNVFGDILGTYFPGTIGRKNFVADVSFEDVIDGELYTFQWIKGTLDLSSFSPGLGKVELHLTGEVINQENQSSSIDLKINMNFEEVHSSVRPNT